MKAKYWTENLSKVPEALSKFGWTNEFDHELLWGWMMAAPFAGSLRHELGFWRPHIAITAEAGAGKTTILNIVHEMLKYGMAEKYESVTEAGLRQSIKHNAIPIIIDELDTNNVNEQGFQKIISLFRLASSGGKLVKGTPGGKNMNFQARFCGLIAGINLPKFSEADQSRFCTLELTTKNRKQNWSELEPEIRKILNETTGHAMMSYLQGGYDTLKGVTEFAPRPYPNVGFPYAFKLFRDMLLMIKLIQNFKDSRTAQQYGVILGALKSFYDKDDFDTTGWELYNAPKVRGPVFLRGEWREDEIDDWITASLHPSPENETSQMLVEKLKKYFKSKDLYDDTGKEIKDTDATACWDHLRDLVVHRDELGRNITLSKLLEDRSTGKDSKNEILSQFKIKIIKDAIFVPSSNAQLKKHFDRTNWASSWTKALGRLDDVEKSSKAKIEGYNTPGIKLLKRFDGANEL